MITVKEMGLLAKEASYELAVASTKAKNEALINISEALIENKDLILSKNDKDLQNGKSKGLSAALLDRLRLNDERISNMAKGIYDIVNLSDPIGKVLGGELRPNGLNIREVTVPLGVIGIIFEARPNVTSDATALCLKSGNAVILKGGKEAINSNLAIVEVIRETISKSSLPENSVQLITDTSRKSTTELMSLTEYLDVLIPRGGKELINAVSEQSKVPVIQTGAGNCHIYVDKYADINMAAEIIYNAKTSRPSVCNAIETVLVHKDIAKKALPNIKAYLDNKNVEIRGCKYTKEILGDSIIPASEEDYFCEYLDYIVAIKVVDTLDEAIRHINHYSTSHSEAIITTNFARAKQFENRVDSAVIYVNASTRFTDGAELGLGAEIGISTQKLHARGPMGLAQLTSSKYIIEGNGQIR